MDGDPAGNTILFDLLLLLFFTLMNAYFAGAEMAVVSVNKNRIRSLAEEGNKKAKVIEGLFDDSTKFLSTIQVAITLGGDHICRILFLGVCGGRTFTGTCRVDERSRDTVQFPDRPQRSDAGADVLQSCIRRAGAEADRTAESGGVQHADGDADPLHLDHPFTVYQTAFRIHQAGAAGT